MQTQVGKGRLISGLVCMLILLNSTTAIAKDNSSYVQTIQQTEGWYLTESARNWR